MKYFLVFCLLLTITNGCKKAVDDKPVAVQPTEEKPPIQEAMEHLDRSKMKTPEGAIEVLSHLPQGGPIMPDMLPIKDLTLKSKTDTTMSYTYTSGTSKMKIKLELRKITVGTETSWDLLRIEPMPN